MMSNTARMLLILANVLIALACLGLLANLERLRDFFSIAKSPPRSSPRIFELPQGETYYPFKQTEVETTFHLTNEDIESLQVYIYGDLNLVSVSVSRSKRQSGVVDGKPIAKEEETTTVQPFTIPHMTPGVIIDRNVVDFGGIQVEFDTTRFFFRKSEMAKPQIKYSRPAEDYGLSLLIADERPLQEAASVGDEFVDVRAGGQTYQCKHRNESDRHDPSFLVFRGGDKFVKKNVDRKDELRARGRVVK